MSNLFNEKAPVGAAKWLSYDTSSYDGICNNNLISIAGHLLQDSYKFFYKLNSDFIFHYDNNPYLWEHIFVDLISAQRLYRIDKMSSLY